MAKKGVEDNKSSVATVEKDFNWYLKAAEQGNAKAQFEVGCCYDKGEGVEKNTEKAFNWYMKAAEQGLVGAQFAVGGHYFFGLSIEKDEKEGLKWFKKAAEQDNRVKKFVVSLEKNREKDKKTKSELLTAVNEIKKEESNTTNAEVLKRLDDMARDIAEIKENLSKNNIQIKPEELTAFVIMQFGGVFDTLYHSVITPVCEKLGYKPVRADESCGERILEDIVNGIAEASLVIADITKDNPNVFYELGYAHALKKPTILLADKNQRDKLPFDTQDYRTIFYENTIDGKEKVENMLRKYMEKYQEKSCIKN